MVKSKYLVAKPKAEQKGEQKDQPDPKRVKARITEYQLFGMTVLSKITFIEEVEL